MTDAFLAMMYAFYAWTYHKINEKELFLYCVVLSCMFILDGVALAHCTEPSRVLTLPDSVFRANTAINVASLVVYCAYL